MSVKNPELGAAQDPFQLERLAEELASRESTQDLSTHDLPVFVPLSHDNPYLAPEEFNVEEFLLSRAYTSLPDLRSELRDYLASLKEELVKLINDDYEAFISLSTDLKDEGARLAKLEQPLDGLKSEILASKEELTVIQEAIQDKLRWRATLREEKALLQLLLKISESVTRLESLLLISQPSENDGSAIGQPYLASDGNNDDRIRGARAKHLNRVASEYIQLLYHTSKARAENCAFVEEVQWRIDRIQSTLSSDLDHFFATRVTAVIDGQGGGGTKVSDIDKPKLMADLAECLRAYDMLGLWQDAEEVLQKHVVRDFVRKTIFPGALTAPPSPIVPHTPFQASHSPETFPKTPYTPYALTPRQAPTFLGQSALSHTRLLDGNDDPLARLYTQILRFVERDLSRIMEIAEKASFKSGAETKSTNGSSTPPALDTRSSSDGHNKGFSIFANVVWAEVGTALMDELGSVVFAAGKPNEFKKNYETSQIFLRCLELLAPSLRSVELMRSHPVFTSFQRRWQLPVYFQMRWKDIVGKLETSLSTTRIEQSTNGSNGIFAMRQTAAAWAAISSCWNPEVYMPELSARFWKLTLQIISRFKTWLDQSLAIDTSNPSSVPDRLLGPTSTPRAGAQMPQPDPSAESVATDDDALRQHAIIISDIRNLRTNVLTLWRQEISIMLPEEPNEGHTLNVEDALQQSLATLMSLVPSMATQIMSILNKRCCDALLPVRSIPSQFRAMSNKRMPTEASHFVPSILRPLKSFFCIGTDDGPGASLKQEYLDAFANEVFESVAQRYSYYLTAMRKTEESLRRLKKGKKVSYSLFGSSTSSRDDDGKDEARIRTQMSLDVEAFGKDGESLGVKLEKCESFKSLHELVLAPLSEDA